MTAEILKIQIESDWLNLLTDISEGVFTGRPEELQKAFGKINEKVRHCEILKEENKDLAQILAEENMADEPRIGGEEAEMIAL